MNIVADCAELERKLDKMYTEANELYETVYALEEKLKDVPLVVKTTSHNYDAQQTSSYEKKYEHFYQWDYKSKFLDNLKYSDGHIVKYNSGFGSNEWEIETATEELIVIHEISSFYGD